ncbi:zinc finger protein 845 [Parasteatoda tepidariorum]|nr:zinc finger protein OZF [Parasteatoda tepidariorum]
MDEDIESPEQNSLQRQRFKTTSVCVKMKFDALEETMVTDERNFIVVHEMYQCSKCYKIFNEESALTDHDCIRLKEFGSTSNVSADVLNSCRQGKYAYDCDQCELSFTKKVMLRKHRNQAHKTKRIKELECVPCNLKFADKDSLLLHRKSHYVEKWFKCDQCGKRFAYEKLLDWHVRRQHLTPKRIEIYQCEICDKVMSNRNNLSRHRALHNLPNSKKFTCEICNASFPLKAYLQRHSLSHSQERPYMCEKCGKTFKAKSGLSKHSLTHEPKDFQGGKSRKRKYYKPLHKYACDKCGKRFTSTYYLKIHYYIHTGERPHKCDVCSKGFRYKELLKNHLFVHSDVRFTCEVCDKQYSNKGAYQKHIKLHNEAEAIPCNYCDMLFSSKSALISHTVVHTKEKPYECELCHRRYSQKGSLNKHPCSRAAAKSTAEILLNLISRNDNL